MTKPAQTNIKPVITREMFIAAVGRPPENDDLDRCNCSEAGTVGHYHCGWDEEANLPEFETARFVKTLL